MLPDLSVWHVCMRQPGWNVDARCQVKPASEPSVTTLRSSIAYTLKRLQLSTTAPTLPKGNCSSSYHQIVVTRTILTVNNRAFFCFLNWKFLPRMVLRPSSPSCQKKAENTACSSTFSRCMLVRVLCVFECIFMYVHARVYVCMCVNCVKIPVITCVDRSVPEMIQSKHTWSC